MENKPKLYAILVAVDEYKANVNNLRGCKEDIKEFQNTIFEVYKDDFDLDTKNLLVLKDNEATYYNVIIAFDNELFNSVKKTDTFIFYYSGHGCRERQAKEFNAFYPEGFSETLVLHDSRAKDGRDLADKEIAVLLHKISLKCENIIVIFDCCHSGSGTRNINDIVLGETRQTDEDLSNSLNRNAYTQHGERKYESYLNGYYLNKFGQEPQIPYSKHILLAACDEKEKARELRSPNIGAFTKFLTKAIKTNKDENYISLINITRNNLLKSNILQNPRLNAYLYFNAHSTFLLNNKTNKNSTDLLFKDNTWRIPLGAIHGIPVDKDFFIEATKDSKIITKGKVNAVYLDYSIVTFEDEIDINEEYLKATLLSPKNTKYLFLNNSDEIGNIRLKEALSKYIPFNFELSNDIKNTKYGIICTTDRTSIYELHTNKEIIAYTGDDLEEIFSSTFNNLEEIAKWENKLKISNKNNELDSEAIDFIFINEANGKEYKNEEIVEIEIEKNDNGELVLEYSLKIINNSNIALKCSLLKFDSNFGIIQWAKNIELTSSKNSELKLDLGENKTIWIPENKSEDVDIFKVYFAVESLDLDILSQKSLSNIKEYDNYGFVNCKLGAEKGGSKATGSQNKFKYSWLTKEIKVISKKKELSFGTEIIKVNDNIIISAPANLKGEIYSRVISGNNKSLDQNEIIFQFIEENKDLELFNFSYEKSISGSPNCLEFKELENIDILKTHPLEIEINAESNDTMLPITYDGQHFVPLDLKYPENGKYKFSFNYLPTYQNDKDIGQAIKLFFIKISESKINHETHKLQLHKINGIIVNDNKEIKNIINENQKILLLVHGIFGNTKQMLEAVQKSKIRDKFEVILTFNYENLNTPIDATSGELLDQLLLIGINKDKKITVLAHSMGGLISRYMVEQLKGNELVSKLILVGTPNLGSKFAEVGSKYVFQWLPIMFYLLNVIRDFSQIAKIFDLASGKLKMDKTLNQMTWDNEDRWLKNLSKSKDPEIPYYIISGNLEQYLNLGLEHKEILNKIYKLGAKLFYPLPQVSDLIVNCESMIGIPNDRLIKTKIFEVPSIHMSYFNDELSKNCIINCLE